MQNRILLLVVVLLSPLVVISFFNNKKTNFYLEEDPTPIMIYLKDRNENIELNEYVIGVVAAEMPALFEIEALKTQSVISRTFALYQMNHNGYVTLSDQAYITNDEMHSKWQEDYQKYYNKIESAVLSTNNEVIYCDNNLIKSYYFAISNGTTISAKTVFNEDLKYIQAVDSSYDKLISKYLSTTTIPLSTFLETLNINEIKNININQDESKYVNNIIINDNVYSGIEFRKIFSLKSASFDIDISDNVTITNYGYGHGVGLSQYGANELAKSNLSYQDIIKHYYQNIIIKNYVY